MELPRQQLLPSRKLRASCECSTETHHALTWPDPLSMMTAGWHSVFSNLRVYSPQCSTMTMRISMRNTMLYMPFHTGLQPSYWY